jgi:hypothetical protein
MADTPNKEPKNLDEAIQLFKGYIREENGFDELDFKSYVQFRSELHPSVENPLKEVLKVVGEEDGLRQKIKCALGYCEANHHGGCLYESSRNESQELDLIVHLIKSRDQRIALEARKSERIKARQFYAKRNPLYTREWIADLLGISRPTLNKWLNDPGMFTVDAIQKLATLKQSQKEE